MYNHYGGFFGIRERLGMSHPRKTGEYSLDRWENFLPEIVKLVRGTSEEPDPEDVSSFPTAEDLKRGFPRREDFEAAGKCNVLAALWRSHGGMNAVMKRLGFPIRHEEGLFRDTEYFVRVFIRKFRQLDADPSPEEIEKFPTRKDLRKGFKSLDLDAMGLLNAVCRWYGGVFLLKRKLGFPPIKGHGIYSPRHWPAVERDLWQAFGKHRTLDFHPDITGKTMYTRIVSYYGTNQARERFKGCIAATLPAVSTDLLRAAGVNNPVLWDVIKWRLIIQWRYGLCGSTAQSLEDLADAFSTSPRVVLSVSNRLVRLISEQEIAGIDSFLENLDKMIISAWDSYRERRRAEAVEKVREVLALMPDNREIRALREKVIREAVDGEENPPPDEPPEPEPVVEKKPAAESPRREGTREEWREVSFIIPDLVCGKGLLSIPERRLTNDEASQLVARAQEGNSAAREALVSLSIPLARKVARRYAGPRFELDELVSAALVGGGKADGGLWGAIDNYRHTSPFDAWAARVMKFGIGHFMRPRKKDKDLLSLDQPFNEDEDWALSDMLADTHPDTNVEEKVMHRLKVERLNAILSEINVPGGLRDKAIFYLHYESALGDEEIARCFGVVREYVRQIVRAVRDKLVGRFMEEVKAEKAET